MVAVIGQTCWKWREENGKESGSELRFGPSFSLYDGGWGGGAIERQTTPGDGRLSAEGALSLKRCCSISALSDSCARRVGYGRRQRERSWKAKRRAG
jgi:hypothetical protein